MIAIETIKKVGVIGAGTMGNGIAHVFALSGWPVVLVDAKKEFLERGLATIKSNLERQLSKQAITAEQKEKTLASISPATSLDGTSACQLVVEAVPEDFGLKKEVFMSLDKHCPPETILASNTSSLPITAIAAATKRPGQVIGMHFMNPVPLMKLVELVRGAQTSDATFAAVKSVSEKLGKVPVEVNDYPGFVSNRILMPMINEACFALMEGVASKEAIDTVMKLGANHPMGPLTLADFIGLDVCLAIMQVLYDGFKDPKYRPCPLLVKMVQAGYLGKKTKKGFYDYQS
ncbi:MAG: 3-hydroxybutyryl-CoA dehydrogenase [candidate division Zixibacteria bacterium]|nr:3-hydroxybutyryl-CoA dehydrogenase [candidate division Zixibacteria bacterium]